MRRYGEHEALSFWTIIFASPTPRHDANDRPFAWHLEVVHCKYGLLMWEPREKGREGNVTNSLTQYLCPYYSLEKLNSTGLICVLVDKVRFTNVLDVVLCITAKVQFGRGLLPRKVLLLRLVQSPPDSWLPGWIAGCRNPRWLFFFSSRRSLP